MFVSNLQFQGEAQKIDKIMQVCVYCVEVGGMEGGREGGREGGKEFLRKEMRKEGSREGGRMGGMEKTALCISYLLVLLPPPPLPGVCSGVLQAPG